jgi:hypothetical protein
MALVVPSKADRVEKFHRNTLEALQELLEATGLHEPSELSPRHIMQRVSETQVLHLSELVETVAPLALLQKDISNLPVTYQDWALASASRFGLNV